MTDPRMTTEQTGLTTAGIEAYLTSLSNWGRWGDDDRIGTLNLITAEVRVAAASIIRTGRAVSLSRPIDALDPDPLASGFALVQRFMTLNEVADHLGREMRYEAAREYVGIGAHGSNTHIDGLAHYSWDGRVPMASRKAIPIHCMARDRCRWIRPSTASSRVGCYWTLPLCMASPGSSAATRSRRTSC